MTAKKISILTKIFITKKTRFSHYVTNGVSTPRYLGFFLSIKLPWCSHFIIHTMRQLEAVLFYGTCSCDHKYFELSWDQRFFQRTFHSPYFIDSFHLHNILAPFWEHLSSLHHLIILRDSLLIFYRCESFNTFPVSQYWVERGKPDQHWNLNHVIFSTT